MTEKADDLSLEEFNKQNAEAEKLIRDAKVKKLEDINIEDELTKIVEGGVKWSHIREVQTLFSRHTNTFNVFNIYTNMQIIHELRKINSGEAVQGELLEVEEKEDKLTPLLEELLVEMKKNNETLAKIEKKTKGK